MIHEFLRASCCFSENKRVYGVKVGFIAILYL